ncbi:MAG: hypothetical protein WKF76_09795 [Nocardioidaceae bacterium]
MWPEVTPPASKPPSGSSPNDATTSSRTLSARPVSPSAPIFWSATSGVVVWQLKAASL